MRQQQSVGSVRKSGYRSEEYLQRELERIYSLSARLISRLLMKSVREESDQVLAARLWRAVVGAERLAITRVRARKIL